MQRLKGRLRSVFRESPTFCMTYRIYTSFWKMCAFTGSYAPVRPRYSRCEKHRQRLQAICHYQNPHVAKRPKGRKGPKPQKRRAFDVRLEINIRARGSELISGTHYLIMPFKSSTKKGKLRGGIIKYCVPNGTNLRIFGSDFYGGIP